VTEDTAGTNLHVNNRRFNLVVWVAQATDSTDSKVFVNAPSGFYSNDSDAIADVDNTAERSFPDSFGGTGLLVARIVLKFTNASNGTLEILQISGANFEDLRQVGAGGGGVVITQTSFSDANFEIFNSTDPTKLITFSSAGIAAGTTRSYIGPDADGTLALALP